MNRTEFLLGIARSPDLRAVIDDEKNLVWVMNIKLETEVCLKWSRISHMEFGEVVQAVEEGEDMEFTWGRTIKQNRARSGLDAFK